MYMVCYIKEGRGPLLKLMEQAQSGFGLLQGEEEFIRIMLHVNADSRVGIFCSWTELHELITIAVEYLIVSKLGSIYMVYPSKVCCMII